MWLNALCLFPPIFAYFRRIFENQESSKIAPRHFETNKVNTGTVVRAVRTRVLETQRSHSQTSTKTARSWCARVNRGTHRSSRVNKALPKRSIITHRLFIRPTKFYLRPKDKNKITYFLPVPHEGLQQHQQQHSRKSETPRAHLDDPHHQRHDARGTLYRSNHDRRGTTVALGSGASFHRFRVKAFFFIRVTGFVGIFDVVQFSCYGKNDGSRAHFRTQKRSYPSVMFFSAVGFGILLMRAVEMGAYCFTVAGLLVLLLL